MITINWGTKIVILYSGFVLLIVTLVWKSTHTKVDLVSEDYYTQEVNFQKKLDAHTNSARLSHKPIAGITADAILVFFPQEFSGKGLSADVQLYNPSNAALDKSFTALGMRDGRIEIPRKDIVPASYIIKLSWSAEGRDYYEEMPVKLSGK
jgi:hypothetical protein